MGDDNDPRLGAGERAAEYVARREAGESTDGGASESEPPRPSTAMSFSAEQRAAVVETAVQQAIRAGAFDDLPGAGKPIEGLGASHDPDWWIRRKIQSEQLTGLGPAALTLRVEAAGLDDALDALHSEAAVREAVEDFNRRVVEARRQLLGGPPVVTATRDVEVTVAQWRARRADHSTAGSDEGRANPERRRRLLRRRKP